MIDLIRRAVRGAYGVPIVGYLLGLMVGILTLPRMRDRVRALSKGARDQRLALRRAIKANDTAVALKRHLPAFMIAISSVKALAFQVAKTDAAVLALDAKVEATLRRINGAGNSLELAPTPEILSPEKLRTRPLKLNLGSGLRPLDGHVNIDARRVPGVDIVASFDHLPLDVGSVDEIRSTHLLERFDPQRLETVLLPSWVRLLKVGGCFSAVVLDADAMIRAYAEGVFSFDEFREAFFAPQQNQASTHFHLITPESLGEALRAAGLVQITVIATGRRNGKAFEFELSGIRA